MAECTRATRRCENARQYDTVLAECCRSHVIQITRDVAETLANERVTFWADYGTLLGAVRNPMTAWTDYPWLPQMDAPIAPGIVPHDKDGDLGLLMTEWKKVYMAMRTLAREKRYDLLVRPHRGSMKVRLSNLNHTNLDLFFWYERPEGTMYRSRYAGSDAFKGREFPKTMIAELATVQWEGLTLPSPADPEAFLAMRYGDNWKVPVCANNDGVKRD